LVFGGAPVFQSIIVDDALMGLGMLSMIAAALVAVFQSNVKRMLAYSSLSQIGYMVLGPSLGSVAGLAAGIIHIFNHAMMKAALFMAVGCAASRAGVVSVDDFAGLGRRMPVTMAAIVVGALSLIGVPLTVGFVTKWYLIQAALEIGAWPAAVVVLASGLIALAYTWRIVEAAYFLPAPPEREVVDEAPLPMLVPLVILAAACIVFGVDSTWPMGLALAAAQSLIGASP
jgi:multicomponent Na+:H+ antiporter subunit D